MIKRKILSIVCAIAILSGMFPTSTIAQVNTLSGENVSTLEDNVEIVDTQISFEAPENLDMMENIALGCSVTSNLACYIYHPASEVTDGEYDYNANEGGGSFSQLDACNGEDWYLTVDLGKAQMFDTIVLRKLNLNGQVASNLTRYQFQISQDGEQWTQLGVAEEEGAASDKDVYFTPDSPQEARYVRLFSENVGGGWLAVDEIEVYGRENAAVPPDVDVKMKEEVFLWQSVRYIS